MWQALTAPTMPTKTSRTCSTDGGSSICSARKHVISRHKLCKCYAPLRLFYERVEWHNVGHACVCELLVNERFEKGFSLWRLFCASSRENFFTAHCPKISWRELQDASRGGENIAHIVKSIPSSSDCRLAKGLVVSNQNTVPSSKKLNAVRVKRSHARPSVVYCPLPLSPVLEANTAQYPLVERYPIHLGHLARSRGCLNFSTTSNHASQSFTCFISSSGASLSNSAKHISTLSRDAEHSGCAQTTAAVYNPTCAAAAAAAAASALSPI